LTHDSYSRVVSVPAGTPLEGTDGMYSRELFERNNGIPAPVVLTYNFFSPSVELVFAALSDLFAVKGEIQGIPTLPKVAAQLYAEGHTVQAACARSQTSDQNATEMMSWVSPDKKIAICICEFGARTSGQRRTFTISRSTGGTIEMPFDYFAGLETITKPSGSMDEPRFTINIATSRFDLLETVEAAMANLVQVKVPTIGKANILVQQHGSLTLRSFDVKRPSTMFEELYDQPALDLFGTLQASLRANKTGVALLHGDPGTGKTSYIRELICKTPEKTFIIMPPELFESVTGPQLMQFMLQNNRSVLIIEDAEKLLLKRAGDSNAAISTLLNMGDGLLADALAMPILCTFNTAVTNLDPAILRPGRLLGRHEFKGLSVAKAQAVFDKFETPVTVKSPVTVATLFEVKRLIETGEDAKAHELLYAAPSFGFGVR
jgi:ATPase family associated with various cellular activities (AAA)